MISEKYKDLYLSTTKGQLKKLSDLLLYLEKKPSNQNLIENIFRLIHSMKGAAATMGYKKTVDLLHAMESLVDSSYHGDLVIDSRILNLFFDTFDVLKENFGNIDKKNQEVNLNKQILLLKNSFKTKVKINNKTKNQPREKHILGSLPTVAEVNISTDRLDSISNLLDDLLINFIKVKNLAQKSGEVEFLKTCSENDQILSGLRSQLEKIRIVSLKEVLSSLPYLVKEIARNEGKKAEIVIRDHDLSLDKAIVDELMEMLIQLIKNAVAHGISKQQRNGKILIDFSLQEDRMQVLVSDNGQGINWHNIGEEAIKNKIISRQKFNAMTSEEKKNIIFYVGVSRGKQADNVAGRGIGLSLVKSKVAELSGSINVSSVLNKGTQFIIDLPRPLSVFRGIIFGLADYNFALPLDYVEKLVALDEVNNFSKTKIFSYQKKQYNIISFVNFLNIKKFNPWYKYVALINYQGKRLALPIFRKVEEEELIMKRTPLVLKNNRYIRGVAVSSSGQVVLVLNISSLI